jgi:hypothetical protein
MTVTVHYECDGCCAKAEGKEPLRVRFISITGRSYGIGSVRPVNTPESVAPDGWWVFDQYTHLCYCPTCRAKIEGPEADHE